MRPVVEEITAITDEFCAEHLDDEYAQLCRRLSAKLARKRPSPLARGDRLIWAAGVVHVIGRAGPSGDEPPHVPHNPGRPTGPTRRTPLDLQARDLWGSRSQAQPLTSRDRRR
jgi:hypothetical protein